MRADLGPRVALLSIPNKDLSCFVMEATPKREENCLFERKIWIDTG